jgi:predicted ATPase
MEMSKHPKEFSIRLRNYGSFTDSETFVVRPGLNTFLGVNNAGKTVLLFALASLSSSARTKQLAYPHGTVGEFLKRYKRADGDPTFDVEFPIASARGEILKSLCSLASNPQFPNEGALGDSLRFVWVLTDDVVGLVNIYSRVSHEGRVIEKELLRLVHHPPNPDAPKVIVAEHPYGFDRPNSYRPPEFDVVVLGSRTEMTPFRFQEPQNQISSVWPGIFESVVLLSTHRNSPARAQHQYAVVLDPTASNLPQVLASIQLSSPDLQNGRDLFDKIEHELRLMFPEIRRVRTEIVPNQHGAGQPFEVEVKLDLTTGGTVPLSHSGTGVQQVLALLTGAIVSKNRSLFLLDEPHSYLHPSAERGVIKLIERLGDEHGHFFCVATHSPIFASHSRKQLYAVRTTSEDGSKVRSLSAAADILSVIGVNNPDLFTYSRVLFVEGQSDEKVVRAISDLVLDAGMEYRLKIQPLGGDGILKSRSRAEFIDLLLKANSAEVNVPLRFVLDSNDWSNEERGKLSALRDTENGQVVHFLKLPELENYLLNAEAIVFALEQRLASRNIAAVKPTVAAIRKIIDGSSATKGSDTLAGVFSKFGCDYSKNKDIEHLLSHMIANAPEHLRPLIDELSPVLGGTPKDRKAS